ncbi:MAG: polysaccharide deacetylase [Bacteroidota bacterium]|nr:polysaccharide deacetylase [Bacteroidota bacterium]
MLDALLFTKTPSLLSAVYRECLWKVNTKENILYLTFDDGPIPAVTPFVLDQLNRYNAKATFFCIGKNIEANPEIFQRILDEGHSIGNHTQDHLNGWYQDNETYFQNIEKCAALIPQFEIRNPKFFRPPYGKLKPRQYRFLKSSFKIVMWDVLSFDFDLSMSEERVLRNVTENATAGSIVVFHDSIKAKSKVEYALPKTLEYFSAKGFKFEKL